MHSTPADHDQTIQLFFPSSPFSAHIQTDQVEETKILERVWSNDGALLPPSLPPPPPFYRVKKST